MNLCYLNVEKLNELKFGVWYWNYAYVMILGGSLFYKILAMKLGRMTVV